MVHTKQKAEEYREEGKQFITDGEVEMMRDRFEAADAMEELENEMSQINIDRAVEILTDVLPVEQAAVGPLAVEVQRLEKKLANKAEAPN